MPCLQTCSKCQEVKPTTDYYVSRYLSTGLHSQCKKCVRNGQEKRVRCPPEEAATSKVCRQAPLPHHPRSIPTRQALHSL